MRRRHRALRWTLAGALCVAAAHAAFWIWLAPVNAIVASTSPAALPDDWAALRAQWEYTHAVRALLQTAALAALVTSVLVEVPRNRAARASFAAVS